jgi:hypothetical protein
LKPLQNGNVKFKKEILKEISFGVNTSEKDIAYYKNLINKNNFKNVIFKKAKTSKNNFTLEFEEI